MTGQAIYLDYNTTTPVSPSVAMAMMPYLYEHFGASSSDHVYGQRARQGVDEAREQVAVLLGSHPGEIVFTTGASEGNHLAIRGLVHARRSQGRHVVTTAVEHASVVAPCRLLVREGCEVTTVPVDGAGRVDPDAVASAIRDDTVLVSVQHANHEVGTIQSVPEIVRRARARGVAVHADAAQSVGKLAVRVDDLGVDLLTVSGHKIYGPKGVGALYVRSGVELEPPAWDSSYESGRGGGIENVQGIVGLGAACALAAERQVATSALCQRLRDRLWTGLQAAAPETQRLGDAAATLPNTLSVAFPRVEASRLLADVSARLAASPSATCHAEGVSVSPVLEAMNVPLEVAMGTIRLSVGHPTREREVEQAVVILSTAAGEARIED